MSASIDCGRVAELLERFDAGELADVEVETLAAHLESCAACSALDSAADRVLRESLRDLAEPLPEDAFFQARLAATMDAVAERRASAPRGPSRSATRGPSQRVAVVGTIAAGAVLALGVVLLLGRGERSDTRMLASTRAGDARGTRVEVVSVDEVDAAELAASEDAWLVARYDSLELQLAGDVDLEDLTEEELDAVEAVIGSSRERG